MLLSETFSYGDDSSDITSTCVKLPLLFTDLSLDKLLARTTIVGYSIESISESGTFSSSLGSSPREGTGSCLC